MQGVENVEGRGKDEHSSDAPFQHHYIPAKGTTLPPMNSFMDVLDFRFTVTRPRRRPVQLKIASGLGRRVDNTAKLLSESFTFTLLGLAN